MNIYEKIIAVSEKLRVPKEGKNEFKGFGYFKGDDIAIAILPLLKEHGLILFFDMPFNKDKGMYEGKLTVMESGDDEKGKVEYQFDIPLAEVQGANPAQNAGATLTYCKRYMTMSAFNIADNDSDPDHTMGQSTRKAGKTTTGGKPSTKFDEMMKKLDKVKKDQLDIFLEKIKISTQYSDEQKNMFIARVMELKQQK